MKMLRLIFLLILFSSPAFSETIISCGPTKGYAFYFEGGFVPKDKSGWSDDGTSGGQTVLIKVDEKFDILYRDAAGQIVSSRADGASVNLLGFKVPWINILVNYPNATSSFYSFNIVEKIFAYSQHKYGDMPIRKVGSYFGKCK